MLLQSGLLDHRPSEVKTWRFNSSPTRPERNQHSLNRRIKVALKTPAATKRQKK
ncbi:hypothetical protein ES332_A09G045300v1 [Gossypium tomentosum]|uniref:Uncharacterized protein n=1 Tax=Gossypium tomentosum TaxID=34277 RepID=A0A5D2NZ64_GOSTO|nr:hypothetical protein ES332_A09G045300v1 [Gossypium tomentosum]